MGIGYSVKGFFDINVGIVQIPLMLEVLFTQDTKAEDLVCSAPSGSSIHEFATYKDILNVLDWLSTDNLSSRLFA